MASNANTRRLDCEATVDRISNLPRNLKDLILNRLPADVAAKTSILSKAWRNIWVNHPHLVFDDQFFSQLVSKKVPMEDKQVQLSEVSRTISNILLVHSGPILTFHLTVPPDLPLHQCDVWIKNISNNGVRTLDLLNKALVAYKIPSYLFSCSELTRLSLSDCILNPPLKFGGFCNLIEVSLVKVIITADMSFGTKLKRLSLGSCSGVELLGSHFKNYNNLSLLIIFDSEKIDWRLFECTPKMQLNTLGLVLRKVTNVMKKIINLDKLVNSMPRINKLYLDGFFLESVERDADILKRPITTMEILHFECVALEKLAHIRNVLCLIRSSPSLQYLRIKLETEVYSRSGIHPLVLSVEMILHQLETVEILDMVGSMAELLFVEILLASTPSLKWMKLQKDESVLFYPREESVFLRELLKIPRASPDARVIWK